MDGWMGRGLPGSPCPPNRRRPRPPSPVGLRHAESKASCGTTGSSQAGRLEACLREATQPAAHRQHPAKAANLRQPINRKAAVATKQAPPHLVEDVPLQEAVVGAQLLVPPKVAVQQLLHPRRRRRLALLPCAVAAHARRLVICVAALSCRGGSLLLPGLKHAGAKAIAALALRPSLLLKCRQEGLLQLLLLLGVRAALLLLLGGCRRALVLCRCEQREGRIGQA